MNVQYHNPWLVLRAALTAFAATALIAQTTPPTPAPLKYDNWAAIQVRECYLITRGAVGLETGGIVIEYVNYAPAAAKQISFSVLYRGQPALVKDSGTFSTGAVIKHTFENVLFGLSYMGPTPELCRVRKVVFANGKESLAPPLKPEAPL